MAALSRLERLWLKASPPLDLGVFRALWLAVLFALYLPQDYSEWAGLPEIFWKPTPLFAVLGLQPLSRSGLTALAWLFKAALFSGAIGWWTRTSVTVALLSGFYLLGLQNSYGLMRHPDAVAVLGLMVLAFSRCGDAFSIDARMARRQPEASSAYTWPLRTLQLLFCMVFFLAGVCKLRVSGLGWLSPECFAEQLTRVHYNPSFPVGSKLGFSIADSPWLCRLGPIFALSVELTMPFALLSRRGRLVLIPAALALLTGFHLLLGPVFLELAALAVCWVPWSGLAKRVRPAAASARLEPNPDRPEPKAE